MTILTHTHELVNYRFIRKVSISIDGAYAHSPFELIAEMDTPGEEQKHFIVLGGYNGYDEAELAFQTLVNAIRNKECLCDLT